MQHPPDERLDSYGRLALNVGCIQLTLTIDVELVALYGHIKPVILGYGRHILLLVGKLPCVRLLRSPQILTKNRIKVVR